MQSTTTKDSLKEALKDLHDSEDALRVDPQFVRMDGAILGTLANIGEKYLSGDLSLLLHVQPSREPQVIRRLLGGSPRSHWMDGSGFILQFDSFNAGVGESGNEEMMLVPDVQIVEGRVSQP